MNESYIEEFTYVKKEKKRLEFENLAWYIFIFIIVCSIFITKFKRQKLEENNADYLDEYIHNARMLVFIIALILYIYYFKLSYNNLNITSYESKKENYLNMIANLLFVIAGTILLYVENKNVK